jgi:phosphinothricin acetyltransferase
MTINIRDVKENDAESICRIYNHHVRDTIVTFEEIEVTATEMAARIAGISALFPWLVTEENGEVVAYAYAGKFNERAAYRYSVLSTIYVHDPRQGRGIGTQLYKALLDRLRARSIHVALGLISLPNPQSVALHEKCGFRKVGQIDQAGYKFGRWIDVGYWQIIL